MKEFGFSSIFVMILVLIIVGGGFLFKEQIFDKSISGERKATEIITKTNTQVQSEDSTGQELGEELSLYQRYPDYNCDYYDGEILSTEESTKKIGTNLCRIEHRPCKDQGVSQSFSIDAPIDLKFQFGGGPGMTSLNFVNHEDRVLSIRVSDINYTLNQIEALIEDKENMLRVGPTSIANLEDEIKKKEYSTIGNIDVLILSLDLYSYRNGSTLPVLRYLFLSPTGKTLFTFDVTTDPSNKSLFEYNETIDSMIRSIIFIDGNFTEGC